MLGALLGNLHGNVVTRPGTVSQPGSTGGGVLNSWTGSTEPNEQIGSAFTSYLHRLFDPTGTQMDFNKSEAQIDREFAASEAEKNRLFNSAEAEKARAENRYLANTAYSRAVEDMRNAGLNPYLAYGSGGASSPTPSSPSASGTSASSSGARISNSSSLVGTLASSAFNLAAHLLKR